MPDPLLILSQPLEGVSFGLNFSWREDRFEHSVFARPKNGSHDLTLLSSREGNDDQDWPPSPPLQDLHLQEIGGSQVAMAVGMAGGSHWSAACSLIESATEIRFHFDLACRTHGNPGWLGSTYRNSAELHFADNPKSGNLVQLPNWVIQIQPLEVDGSCTEFGSTEQQIQMSVPLKPSDISASSPPKSPSQTLRWQYELTMKQTLH